jgi:hypothetical protein
MLKSDLDPETDQEGREILQNLEISDSPRELGEHATALARSVQQHTWPHASRISGRGSTPSPSDRTCPTRTARKLFNLDIFSPIYTVPDQTFLPL